MYEFKESTNEEIENVITFLVCLVMVFIPVGYIMQDNDFIFGGDVFQKMTPAYIIICLSGALMSMLLVMYFKKRKNRSFNLLDCAVICMCVSLILSTIFSEEPSISVVGVMYTQEGLLINLLLFVMMLSVSIIRSGKRRSIIFHVFLAVGVLEAVIGIMQACFQVDLVSNYPQHVDAYRAYGTTSNPNPYGALMLLFACTASGMFLMEEDRRKKIIYMLLTVLYLYSMVLSGTRAAMLGYICMVPIAIVLYVKYRKTRVHDAGEQNKDASGKKWTGYIIYAAIAIIGIVLVFLLNPNLAETLQRTASDIGSVFTSFASGRGAIWKHAWNVFLEHPLLGVGVSNYRYVAYNTAIVNGEFVSDVYIAYIAHNEILDILVNQGILGFAAYLFFTIVMAVNALRIFFDQKSRYNKKYSYAIILAMVAYFVNSMFGFRLIYVSPYIFVLYGLLIPREELKSIKRKSR